MKNLLTPLLLISGLCLALGTARAVNAVGLSIAAKQNAPTLNGLWRGTFETTGFTVTMDLSLAEAGS